MTTMTLGGETTLTRSRVHGAKRSDWLKKKRQLEMKATIVATKVKAKATMVKGSIVVAAGGFVLTSVANQTGVFQKVQISTSQQTVEAKNEKLVIQIPAENEVNPDELSPSDYVKWATANLKFEVPIKQDYIRMAAETADRYSNPRGIIVGIVHTESKGNSEAQSPPTDNGYSWGLMQVNENTAMDMPGRHYTSEELKDPQTNLDAGNYVFAANVSIFSGKSNWWLFSNYSTDGKYMKYRGLDVTDENGQKIPLLMLATMAYNTGCGNITQALEKSIGKNGDGTVRLVLNPQTPKPQRLLEVQAIDYALKVSKFYDFGYKFGFSEQDVPDDKRLNG